MSTAKPHQEASQPETKECYSFSLVLSGFGEITDEIANAIYGAGCDDALLGVQEGAAFLDFDREAGSLEEAIFSAIRDVKNCGLDVEVVRVDLPGLATTNSINALLDVKRRLKGSHDTQLFNSFLIDDAQMLDGSAGPSEKSSSS
jgi:hypothetical protein